MQVQIKILPAFYFLLTEKAFEKSMDSGRGCAKSTSVADCVLVKCLQKKERVLCARETQKSIDESVKHLLEKQIDKWGLDSYFEITRTRIVCKLTGSEIIFAGLDRSIRSIKSMEGLTLVWIEEAQYVSQASLDILLPTIRTKGAEVWYTWNPTKAEDAVYKRFYAKELPPNCIVKHLTIKDNPFFNHIDNPFLWSQREFAYKHDPEKAEHIWGGKLSPGSGMNVLPRSWLMKAIDAHVGREFGKRFKYIGFDIADTGEDKNALCLRNGAVIEYVEDWNNRFISDAVEHVDLVAKQYDVARVYFDATGVGAGAKGDFNRITDRIYKAHAFVGASQPGGYDSDYLPDITNGKFFRNLKAQAWWNVRLRLENTLRLIEGEDIDPNKCLFISGKIPALDELISELSQAVYEQDDGKLMVDKAPDEFTSPNMADAVVLAFAHDLTYGLKGY